MWPLIQSFLRFLLPPQCPCCERFLEEGERGICPECSSKIHWIDPPFCSACGTPFLSHPPGNHLCGPCISKKKYFTISRALGSYEGSLQEAIHRWKYEGKLSLNPIFVEWLQKGLSRHWGSDRVDLLVPVPLHLRRLRERGFNQAHLLVKGLSRRTGIPYRNNVLQKRIHTLPQVNLSGPEREKGIRGAFQAAAPEAVKGRTILLVDDVYTTGATVNECAKVLLAAGAERVDVLTLARAVKHR